MLTKEQKIEFLQLLGQVLNNHNISGLSTQQIQDVVNGVIQLNNLLPESEIDTKISTAISAISTLSEEDVNQLIEDYITTHDISGGGDIDEPITADELYLGIIINLTAYSTDPFLDQSLVSFLPLDNNLTDSVTNTDARGDGTYSFVDAKLNQGVQIDPSSAHDRWGFSFNNPIQEDQPFAIGFYFKGTRICLGTLGLLDSSTGGGYGLGYNGGASLPSDYIEDVSNGAANTSIFALYTGKAVGRGLKFAVDPDNFIHIVVQYTGTQLEAYINGTLVGTADHSDGWATTYTRFATYNDSYYDDYVYVLDGIIDHLQIFNRALTADEVQTIYNRGEE